MRVSLILLTAALLATLGAVPAGSATKYKPCTLLISADLEGALKAKVTEAQKEGGDVDNEPGPLQGETIDWCSWILGSGSDKIGVLLRVTRAIASVPQMAEAWYAPAVEGAKQDGGTVERVNVAGAECRIFGNIKVGGLPIKHGTSCLTAGKGRALEIEINTTASAPVPAAVAQGLLTKAVARLP